ncbi:MAG: ATP-dependent helicase HrpB [Alphaproteobacteria bacterium]|nr:ATP-dependent helicase HrpB [Alphaproteobacteria bacterium]
MNVNSTHWRHVTLSTPLPIDDALPAVRSALAEASRLVIAAPPGAGKTTRVPIDLLAAPWADGRILLLEPRRIAARLAAERMAASLGEPVSGVIGLSTRIDRRVSDRTRIEVITDGLFTRRILADPELKGVCAVLFDEFHERSINIDLGLALAREAQGALRDDLRLVVMSATLDVAGVAAKLDAPAIESEGRMFPVDTRYLGRTDAPIDAQIADAVTRALREESGSILAFLPGRGEIERAAARLQAEGDDVDIAPLYGALPPRAQDAAVAAPAPGRRKVVLATDIAESSLTIDGVRIVIDAGLARTARHDPGTGETRLVTMRASLASVDQRRGRAGRTGPGVCYRLWREPETRGFAPAATPEILTGDLAGLALALAEWGERDATRLPFIDPPPPARLAAARERLRQLGALDASDALTPAGREIARLPVAPWLAAMIVRAGTVADRALAARLALLIGEPGLGGRSSDLRDRLAGLERDRSPRATTLKRQAASWAGGAAPDASGDASSETPSGLAPANAGALIARGDPMRIARRIDRASGRYQLASGREARLDPADPLGTEEWLAVGDATGAAAHARILAAAPLAEADALAIGPMEASDRYELGADGVSLKGRRIERLGAIRLAETPLPRPRGEAARAALLAVVADRGLDILPSAPAIRMLQIRLALAGDRLALPQAAITDAGLIDRREIWLGPLLGDPPSLKAPTASAVAAAILALFDWSVGLDLERLAPTTFQLPSGRAATIDYGAEGGPAIRGKPQEFYGLARHPAIADGATPLVVVLVSPADRPIATTTDLPSFWTGAYADMAKDMRARYPKHDWPDDPAAARAHAGLTKARLRPT